jgi:hypothetical protein
MPVSFMSMRFIHCAILSLIAMLALPLSAQTQSFSTEPAVFIEEFEKFIQSGGDKKLNEDMKVLKENWNLGKFSPLQQKSIMRISNDMLMEKMTVQPYFG